MPPHGKRFIGTVAYMGGVPAVLEKFCWAWGQLVQYNSEYLCDAGELVHYDRATVSYHSYARNVLAERMRGDWLLMLDTDHEPEPDIAARMVTAMMVHDVDVLTALYHYKIPPHNPVLFCREDSKIQHLGDWDRGCTLIQVAAAGAGCLLIRKRVFDRIKVELNENPFEIRKCFSEDHSFFDRCWDLGIKCYAAPHIETAHLMPRGITSEDYDRQSLASQISKDRILVEGRV